MISLAIDTSAELCAAAVHDSAGDVILAEATEEIGRGHAERLMDVIAGVLAQAGKEYSDIGRVIVTVGPGSFTGVRVGLATARGIALGLSVPVIGVTTLEALAEETRHRASDAMDGPVIAAIDARRGEIYWQWFDANGRGEASCQSVKEAVGAVPLRKPVAIQICGSGAQDLRESMIQAGWPPEMVRLGATGNTARIGTIAKLGAGKPEDARRPEPLYLRAPDAKPQAHFVLPRA